MVLTERATELTLELIEGTDRTIPVSTEKQSGDDPPERKKWLVRLPSGPDSSDRFLRFSYVLEKGSEPIFHVGPDGAFAGGISTAWYPQLLGADGTRMLAIGEIRFEVPPGQSVYTAGKPTHSASQRAAGSFRFRLTEPVYIAFASGGYKIQGHGTLSLYLLRERTGALSYLRRLEHVIQVLAGEFGPFPYKSFALIEVPADAGRAAGFDGASLDGMMLAIGPFLDRPFNLAFYGHEIGHQWWGGVVRRKGTDGAYLMDEALAQWGSLRAVDAIAGPRAAEQHRRVGHPGYYFEYSGFSYLRRIEQGFDHELSTLLVSDGTLSRRMANSKGMLVWDMLAAVIGRERFRVTLKDIVRRNWFRRLAWKDLWDAIESGAGQDLSWFYQQWFARTGAPSWTLSWRQDGKTLRGSIEQGEPFYRLEAKVVINGEECSSRQAQALRIEGRRTEFEWEVPFRASSVLVDPEFEVLHWTEEYRRDAAVLEPFTRGDLALVYGRRTANMRPG
ncbi:MAG: M1 family aminopeptidase [Gemmatimonadales bacterium]